MPVQMVLQGVDTLTNFMKARGGAPREWHVGISDDAKEQLKERGQESNPHAEWVEAGDETTARAIVAYFLQTGVRLDEGGTGGDTGLPPTQVYVYRNPRFQNFGDFLKRKAEEKGQQDRRKRRDEWVSAVDGLNARIRSWLKESDPDQKLVEITPVPFDKLEQGLGAYRVDGLRISLGDAAVEVIPVGRNVVGFIGPRGDSGARAEGRVDVSDGARKYTLYRTLEGGEQWHVLDEEHRSKVLDRDAFEEILEDLLS